MKSEVIKKKSQDPGPDMPVYSLRIASQLSGIPAHSIRQYIDIGILVPYKLDSNRHLFSAQDIARLRNIQFMISEKGLNFAGIKALMALIPCWSMKNCSHIDRHSCNAYTDDTKPCWQASEKGRTCKNENCRECSVYNCLSETTDLKSYIRGLL